jgi:hypothetical protein
MTARGGTAHKQDHAKEANSRGFLPPSPIGVREREQGKNHGPHGPHACFWPRVTSTARDACP